MGRKRSKKTKKSTKKRTVRVRSYKRRPRRMRGGAYNGLTGSEAQMAWIKDNNPGGMKKFKDLSDTMKYKIVK
jgi:hypothetical protein